MTGSWDKTARVWLNEKSVTILQGHEGAVWCAVILPKVGIMVTGSADYSVRLWKGGQCKQKLTGVHTQAVRGKTRRFKNSCVLYFYVEVTMPTLLIQSNIIF